MSAPPAVEGAAPGGVKRGDEAAAARDIREMFARVAPRYDLLNRLLSARIDVLWRRALARNVKEYLRRPEARILDVCCGTGDVVAELENARARLCGPDRRRVLGSDFCRPMLAAAAEKLSKPGSGLVEADALSFPAPDGGFDLITVAFGFRNLANYAAGLRELSRLLGPGGCLAILEFSQPTNRLWGPAFDWYFRNVLPRIGNAVSGAGDAYSYLQRSVERFYTPEGLAAAMRDNGFDRARWVSLTGGIACLHLGYKRNENGSSEV